MLFFKPLFCHFMLYFKTLLKCFMCSYHVWLICLHNICLIQSKFNECMLVYVPCCIWFFSVVFSVHIYIIRCNCVSESRLLGFRISYIYLYIFVSLISLWNQTFNASFSLHNRIKHFQFNNYLR